MIFSTNIWLFDKFASDYVFEHQHLCITRQIRVKLAQHSLTFAMLHFVRKKTGVGINTKYKFTDQLSNVRWEH